MIQQGMEISDINYIYSICCPYLLPRLFGFSIESKNKNSSKSSNQFTNNSSAMKLLLLLAFPATATQLDVIRILTTSSSPTPGNTEKSLPPTITITRIPTPLPTFVSGTPAPSLVNEDSVPSFQPSRFSTPFPTKEGEGGVSGVPVTSAPQSFPVGY
jgi:hypothetical protein